MTNRWFRFYAEALDDLKVQELPDKLFKAWMNILCVACQYNGYLPDLRVLAFRLRISEPQAIKLTNQLIYRELLDEKDGTLSPHNWDQRQFSSDDVTARVRKYRGKRNVSGNVSRNVTETQNETLENRTEQIQKQIQNRTDAENVSQIDFAALADWTVNIWPKTIPEFELGLLVDQIHTEADVKTWKEHTAIEVEAGQYIMAFSKWAVKTWRRRPKVRERANGTATTFGERKEEIRAEKFARMLMEDLNAGKIQPE